MRLDDELDRIGANRFHAYALTACALCSSAQSLVMNFLPILQPCAGAAFGVLPQEAAAVSTYTFLMACIAVPIFAIIADVYGVRDADAHARRQHRLRPQFGRRRARLAVGE